MPESQADAAVEVVKDAMQNFVTKEYFTAELDRRFGAVDKRFVTMEERFVAIDQRFVAIDKRFVAIDERFSVVDSELKKLRSDMGQGFTQLEAKIETSMAELGKSQARGFAAMSVFMVALVSLLFAALQFFDTEANIGAGSLADPAPPPAFESGTANSGNITSPKPQ